MVNNWNKCTSYTWSDIVCQQNAYLCLLVMLREIITTRVPSVYTRAAETYQAEWNQYNVATLWVGDWLGWTVSTSDAFIVQDTRCFPESSTADYHAV